MQTNLGTKSVCSLVTKCSNGFGYTNLAHSRSHKIEKKQKKWIWSIFVKVFRSHMNESALYLHHPDIDGATIFVHHGESPALTISFNAAISTPSGRHGAAILAHPGVASVLKIFFTVVLNNDSNNTTTADHATNFPSKTPSTSARLFSQTARRNVPPLLLQHFSEKKSGPRRRRIAKLEESLTRQHRLGGRACRKLGGAGSSPKNTSIALDRAFPSLTGITL